MKRKVIGLIWAVFTLATSGAMAETCHQLISDKGHAVPGFTLCVREDEANVTVRLFAAGEVSWTDHDPADVATVKGRCVHGRDGRLLYCHEYKVFTRFANAHVDRYAIHVVGGSERSVRIKGRDYGLRPQKRHPERFFGDRALERLAPGAFALQAEGAALLGPIEARAARDRRRFIAALEADSVLRKAFATWETLTFAEQVPLLERIFALEWQALGIARPELVIGPEVTPGAAFFAFDTAHPGPGKILLNSRILAADPNRHLGLLLLIHETRHAAQFQEAFAPSGSPVGMGFKKAFQAQEGLSGKLGFVDFTTLLNEYEAFQFANAVVGHVTQGRADTSSMGTYASQFDSSGLPLIDLPGLARTVGPPKLLPAFNTLSIPQYERMRGLL